MNTDTPKITDPLTAHERRAVAFHQSSSASVADHTPEPRNETREVWVTNRAITCALSRGYCTQTARDFAEYAIKHCPEVQSFNNLLDCYMSQQN